MTDGIGTASFIYHPDDGSTKGAGNLARIDGPFMDDTLKYTYDALGRLTFHGIHSVHLFEKLVPLLHAQRAHLLGDHLVDFLHRYIVDGGHPVRWRGHRRHCCRYSRCSRLLLAVRVGRGGIVFVFRFWWLC